MSTTQRKRRMIPSQQARRGRRRHRSPDATEQEPVEVVESGAEVVDLTCESSEPVVVDLTNNDSVEIVDEGLSSNRQTESLEEQPGRTLSDSCILCSDDEDVEPDGSTCLYVTGTTNVPQGNQIRSYPCNKDLRSGQNVVYQRSSPGTISCPICLDNYTEIVQSGRLIVSTKCGHVFCSQCIRDSLKNAQTCPTCRVKLNSRQCHPLYI
ncbi:RING finger protein 4 isoform X1 [Callorhinchus milii]|uniref:RING finger protein 4 isoform X1 n=1 Tax=Callorhinchus milii TaxID=7868 RepID=UPI0004575B06|nr:RING finger protein 4 isoform X1 [Callorhinchus milii]XP_007903435.1 RING finger protein 4 isoform X1 [Callorhinchus milii]XP_007903436.1 RING finger protein 4 isoform X1 [Callorhinchus milii]|eukprot:gi/632974006/ref/XP_007903434.1/ PREDICTED: E3 ubiquitin-protein ligase RNF4 isoform X1 [Callorhinchus milii]